ncbi:kinase-like domain-containing protein [Suillus paluster]|uniref:kinase-like domain-containing protein n=1 Tax=Suillus paluster TaxID=48578 RepID=UPI001B85F383|nr:kinase-like domain-containing protein [Suillus paluster]KAG1723359.1 kinase-like domain-containing protein [Suillus paluster]
MLNNLDSIIATKNLEQYIDQPPTAYPTSYVARSLIPIPIPDLTGLITRLYQDPIGFGAYGNIYQCVYHGPEGDVQVAVKAIRSQPTNQLPVTFRRELGIWKRLRHDNILKFMGTTRDFGPFLALVAPWISHGTLTSFLDKNKTLMQCDRLLLAAGLDYLHTFSLTIDGHTYSNPIVHGDLTGVINNVLVGSDRTAYLADFGLSGTLTQLPGMAYLAKKSHRPGAKNRPLQSPLKSDIYSLGSIMLQILTGELPWPHLKREIAVMVTVSTGNETHPRPDRVTNQQWDFITRCLSKTPMKRPSAKEALQFVDRELSLLRSSGGGVAADTSSSNNLPFPSSAL